MSRHGVIGLVRCMALDHADAGIRVNAVCPGVMNTPMLDALGAEQRAELAARHPLGCVAEPAEVARTVLHLAATWPAARGGARPSVSWPTGRCAGDGANGHAGRYRLRFGVRSASEGVVVPSQPALIHGR